MATDKECKNLEPIMTKGGAYCLGLDLVITHNAITEFIQQHKEGE